MSSYFTTSVEYLHYHRSVLQLIFLIKKAVNLRFGWKFVRKCAKKTENEQRKPTKITKSSFSVQE